MKRDPFFIGDYLHVYNRGNRKLLIFYNENDKWRFLKMLRYFNNELSQPNLFRQLNLLIKSGECRHFEWPKDWSVRKPLVKILSYCLIPNHFHLLLKEIVKGGISKFIKKIGDGFTGYINIKYGESGRVFQGAYKAKVIKDDKTLQYVDNYIQVFNAFELYPGGIKMASKEFNKAFDFALEYPFCSLGETFGRRKLGIIDRDILARMVLDLSSYKEFVYDALMVRNIREVLGKLTID